MLKVIFSNNDLTQFQSSLSRLLNLMTPVSVKIGTHLDTYTAKVTLIFEGHCDETSMKILREGACLGDGFCGSCEVCAYDLDENGNPEECYIFKKPTSYEYNASLIESMLRLNLMKFMMVQALIRNVTRLRK